MTNEWGHRKRKRNRGKMKERKGKETEEMERDRTGRKETRWVMRRITQVNFKFT